MGLTIIQTLLFALSIYKWIVIAMVVFSWLMAFNVVNMRNDFVRSVGNALHALTEPVLRPLRGLLPNLGGIDISPILLFVAIFFLESFLINVVAPRVV